MRTYSHKITIAITNIITIITTLITAYTITLFLAHNKIFNNYKHEYNILFIKYIF